MRTTLLFAITFVLAATACNKKGEADRPSEPAAKVADPKPPAPKPDPKAAKPAAKSADDVGLAHPDACCCITKQMPGGDVFGAVDPADCKKQHGTCAKPWTQSCQDDYDQQKVADERNQANAQCPSGDRHDCDGDGYRDFEDKNDMDPKVH